MVSAPPIIFDRELVWTRSRHRSELRDDGSDACFIDEAMAEDVLDRLSFLRLEPKQALVTGFNSGPLTSRLPDSIERVEVGAGDEEQPASHRDMDFIASHGALDTVNDLPGALIHLRNALAPGGLMIASFLGAGSLPVLRQCMLAADGERPAARLHPMVDVRAGGQLLQRCGFANPVVDSWGIDVSYRSLLDLVRDLRAQTVGNVLASRAPPVTKAGLARAEAEFATLADGEGRVTEHFEILTLSGWKA